MVDELLEGSFDEEDKAADSDEERYKKMDCRKAAIPDFEKKSKEMESKAAEVETSGASQPVLRLGAQTS
jgi:hypothetical protein